MSVAFEVYYRSPSDSAREAGIADRAGRLGGHLSYREGPAAPPGPGCPTFAFDDRTAAEEAASVLRGQGGHVEGPHDKGG